MWLGSHGLVLMRFAPCLLPVQAVFDRIAVRLGTAVTEASRDPEVRAIVEDTMSAFTATFAERFERAERDGELSPHAPDALAQIATAALNTLAMRARTGASATVLDTLIDATVGVICARPALRLRPCGFPT